MKTAERRVNSVEQKLNQIIEKLRKDFNVPSIMVSVHKDGKTFFCGGGLADIENNHEATPDTIYGVASVSKSFTATALCILADEQKLCLDDTVKKYLPDFRMHDVYRTENLTIRDALGHRSGLARYDLTWLHRQDITMYDFVRNLQYLPATFPMRARMHYQNHMFALASVIAEKVSDKSWDDLLKEKILDPMGMTSTFTKAAEYRGKNLTNASQPYDFIDGKHKKMSTYYIFDHMGGAAAMSSTVRDLDKWARLHLGKGEFEGRRIFSEEMAKNLHNPQMIIKAKELTSYEFDEIDFTSYGQGWAVESYRGHKYVHHGGTIDGYRSLVGFLPKDSIAFSVLTNLNRNDASTALGYYICDLSLGLSEIDWGARFLDVMNSVKEGSEQILNEYRQKAKSAAPPTHPLCEYAGVYEHDAYGQFEIYLQENALFVDIAGYKSPVISYGYNNFYVEFPRYQAFCPTLKFDYDIDGKVCKAIAKLDAIAESIELRRVK